MSYARSIRTTLGPRGRKSALGATPTANMQPVVTFQAQLNRFLDQPIPLDGVLTPAIALAAVYVIIQRFTQPFVNDPRNAAVRALYVEANKHVADAQFWVTTHLVEVTDMLRDFANFTGRPPARGPGASSGKVIALVLAGAAALVILSQPKGRRRR